MSTLPNIIQYKTTEGKWNYCPLWIENAETITGFDTEKEMKQHAINNYLGRNKND